MFQFSDWFISVVFASGILGLVTAGLLIFVNKTHSFSSKLLAAFLVCISLLAFNYGLMTTTFFLRFPHMWRVLVWASYCFSPFAYLYVRTVLSQSFKLKQTDALFFIPALLGVINHIPFYGLPASAKAEHLVMVLNDKKLIAKEIEGLMPAGWMVWGRILLGVATTFGQFFLLARWNQKTPDTAKQTGQNKTIFRWLFLFSLTMAIFYGLIILEFLLHFSNSESQDILIILTISATIFFVSISLLVRPSILYGMTGWMQQANEMVNHVPVSREGGQSEKNTGETDQRTSLSMEQAILYKEAVETHFEKNHPFRKAGYTIAELAGEVDIPTYLLSAFINQQYGKNFNELVNKYRVEYLTELIKKNPEHLQFTMEALGKMAGFNSRTAFIASVKKHTGTTPSEFFARKGIDIKE